MRKMPVKDVSRVESEIDNEIEFIKDRLGMQLRVTQGTRQDAYKAAEVAISAAVEKMDKLLVAKFALRDLKAAFNIENGINERTLRIAMLTEQKQFMEQNMSRVGDVSTTTSYQDSKVRYVPGVSNESQDKVRADVRNLTRQIQRVKDSCAGINGNGKVELPEMVSNILVEFGFIDA